MEHSKRFPYLVLAGAAAAVLFIATGTSLVALAPLLFVLACPLMMVVMMRHMGGGHGGGEDHTGHGCEHDPTRSTVVPRSPGNRTP